jgi:N-acyl homoserine lactone hydrolase
MQVKKLWPLLTATHQYDKSLSTRNRGRGEIITAPILAYLIETSNGRILYDVGCDYHKINNPTLRQQHYHPDDFAFGAPEMDESQRLPAHLARMGLTPADVDVVFIGHLHFDHAGGLCDVCGTEVHIQQTELDAARAGVDNAYFPADFSGDYPWKIMHGEYDVSAGVRAIATPGHTAGHMSLWIELPKGQPVILCGDAADLSENIHDEIAPGLCWQEQEALAIQSICKLKAIAAEENAVLWPNHDIAFWRNLRQFPEFHE